MTANHVKTAELAWAAGLFDGEGTATVCGGRGRLALKMVDEEPVRRFHAAVGRGKVYGPYRNDAATRRDGSPRSPFFYWIAPGTVGADAAAVLWPWLSSPKRLSIERVFGAIWREIPDPGRAGATPA